MTTKGVMERVTATCSPCGYEEAKEFELVGVALHNAAIAWGAEVEISHNSKPDIDHQMLAVVRYHVRFDGDGSSEYVLEHWLLPKR